MASLRSGPVAPSASAGAPASAGSASVADHGDREPEPVAVQLHRDLRDPGQAAGGGGIGQRVGKFGAGPGQCLMTASRTAESAAWDSAAAISRVRSSPSAAAASELVADPVAGIGEVHGAIMTSL